MSFITQAESLLVNEIKSGLIGKDIIAQDALGIKTSHKVALSESPVAEGESGKLILFGQLIQGALIRGELPPNSAVWLNGKTLEILQDGNFVFGFGRDSTLSHNLQWQLAGNEERFEKILVLEKREYNVQRIEGVASKYVSPPNEVSTRIKNDNQKIAKARRKNSKLSAFTQTFMLPAKGPISGVYGSQRVFNGEPKRPHFGLDIAGPVGTPILSPIDGVVSLAHNDMYYSGGTLIIDHGLGVSSTFIHLSAIDVNKGDVIKKGQKIAEMGATGRVTGPHLDWRINWFSERLDPALLVDLSKADK
ncbi:MAG: murein DD-endopeptidase MepM/ murein hydrolase activator NlpD [Glaciecola sp.]|jgi:murein DD-endopeptidase MepM/ murein hydrolase activator NlpD